MPRTQINCPQCRQPIVADIQQLFDVGRNPEDKKIFLSGMFNIAQCPHCGYQGMLASPLVYHDPDKELLLSYFPPELALPIEEQEKSIGPLINQIVNGLPQEKRKGYLFSPKTMLTQQLMVEKVLEADGITKEMIQAQQEKLNLIQRLLSSSEESKIEIINQEDSMIDGDLFNILSRLMEASIAGGDQEAAEQLNDLQQVLLQHSTRGKQLQAEAAEIQSAMQSLQEYGENITRENLLDLVVKSSSDTRLRALVSLARSGMDYTFFQMLSQRIDRARSKGRARLVELREKLLEYTQDYDRELKNRAAIARKNLESLLKVDDLRSAISQNIEAIDEFFIQAVTEALERARNSGDIEHSSQLQQVLDIVEELSAPPAELVVLEEFLEAADDEAKLKLLVESRGDDITSELMQMLNALINQTNVNIEQAGGENKKQQQDLLNRLMAVNNAVLRFSMRRSFKAD